MIYRIARFFERRSKGTLALIAYAIAVILGVLDFLTAVKIHFLLLYLIPIFIGSWFISRNAGMGLAFFTSIVWFGTHSLSNPNFSPWIAYPNLLMRTAVFLVFEVTQAQLRAKLDELSTLAGRDFLTGLPNGYAFYQLAAKEMDRAFGMEPMTLACLDVTGFKSVNSRFGYPTGDK